MKIKKEKKIAMAGIAIMAIIVFILHLINNAK